jgi:hypothetical protein
MGSFCTYTYSISNLKEQIEALAQPNLACRMCFEISRNTVTLLTNVANLDPVGSVSFWWDPDAWGIN